MLFEDLYVSRFKIFFTIQVLNKKMLLIVIFFYNSEPLLSPFLIPWWWFEQGRIYLPDLNNHFFYLLIALKEAGVNKLTMDLP